MCLVVSSAMNASIDLEKTAQLFAMMGNQSRLTLLVLLDESPRTVSALAEAAGLSQPLVSKHLGMLRLANLVAAQREGREIRYRISDTHVSHVIADAIEHIHETSPAPAGGVEENTEE